MSAEGHRPICQDTGIATVFPKVGMNVLWDARLSVTDMVNEGVRRAYNHPDNKMRASVLADPAGKRRTTRENTTRTDKRRVGKERVRTCRARRARSNSQTTKHKHK